ncbi:hypothetical protein Baya_12804 [Bagarius yarrelli]|uniref:Uncharacterized protein n=1 Tax=Bagarius yarrelli TaxID=175774 RepID=A0A556V464_BAGYA|nr:hypothetical protein Baya_12804 [Bagarius yarrelli]
MKTAVWLLCLIGLSMAVQGWPLFPLLKQLTPDQIQQLLQALLKALGPAPAPPAAVPPVPAPTGR